MKRYIALLRGVNIGGKNKIAMAEWKKGLEELGLEEVKTYLNSGNAAFSSEDDDTEKLKRQIEEMIERRFNLKIPVFILLKDAIVDILHNAPQWWGEDGKEIYDNLIFIMPPTTVYDVCNEIGEAKEGLEKVQGYKNVIFWSFCRKEYQKTNWWHATASADVSAALTIRTANTVRKIADM